MNSISDKRDFNRFPMEFMLEVAAEDSDGNKFNEKTVLNDISGEGARFITQQTGKYFPGQSLKMTIYLPGPNDVKADMRGKATVVRIDPSGNSGMEDKSKEVCIAVKLDAPLHFERIDVKTQGNHAEP